MAEKQPNFDDIKVPDFDSISENQFEETVKMEYEKLEQPNEDIIEDEQEAELSLNTCIKSRKTTHDTFFNIPNFEPELFLSHINWIETEIDGPNIYDMVIIGSSSSTLDLAHQAATIGGKVCLVEEEEQSNLDL